VLYIPCNDETDDLLWNGSVRHVRKMKALTVKMDTVTLMSRYIESAYFVY
jgi:hypothetical protein